METVRYRYVPGPGFSAPHRRDLDSPRTLVLVFGASRFAEAPEPLAELAAAYPTSVVVGCSTAGEIHGRELADASLAIAVTRFAHTRLHGAMAPVPESDASYRAGHALSEALRADDLRGILVLSDGLNVNGSQLVRGFNDALPPGVVVTGGLAADGPRFSATWVLDRDGRPVEKQVSAVGFYGAHVQIGHGSFGGWDVFGPERRITRSHGHLLYELDGQPALDLYKTYLGDRSEGLPSTALLFPLALRTDPESAPIVRTVLGVNEETKSMTFAGEVPEGSYVTLMRANLDRLIDGASQAAEATRRTSDPLAGSPTLAIAISCVGRRLVLGPRAEEEIEATMDIMGSSTEQLGFYSYGEISPFGSGACDLHNQTMTITTISERR
jgi:hypothetical protein